MKKALLSFLFTLLILATYGQQTPPKTTGDPDGEIKIADTLEHTTFFYDDPIEIRPYFQGGLKNFYKYLSDNIHYPKEAVTHKIQGKVLLIFVVEKDGTLTHVKVTRGVSDELDAEALRVVRNSPKWKPGTQNGHPVRMEMSLPINFSLDKK